MLRRSGTGDSMKTDWTLEQLLTLPKTELAERLLSSYLYTIRLQDELRQLRRKQVTA